MNDEAPSASPAPAARPPGGGFAAFRARDFRFVAAARFLTGSALQMLLVAVGFQVYAETRDPVDLGLVGLAQFVPMAALALAGGQAADRVDRRLVVGACLAVFVACCAGLFAAARLPTTPLWLVYGLLVVVGAARAFYQPALGALVPSIVPREDLPNAMTWSSAIWQASSVFGPLVGGAVYGLTTSSASVHGAAGAMCAVALACVAFVRRGHGTLDRRPATWATALEGLRYVRANKVILGALTLDFVAVFLGGAPVLLPAFAADVLHVGAAGLGVLRAAPAIGAGLMTFAIAFSPMRGDVGRIMLSSVAAFGAATIGFGLSTSFALSLFFLGVLGAADMVSVVVRQSLVYLRTPDEMRGRVSAVNQVFVGASNELGDVESGVAAGLVGVVPAVVAGGAGTLLVVALWARLFPDLRRVQRLD